MTVERRNRGLRITAPAFGVAFNGAVAPGPMLALVISQTLARGFDAVWAVLLGHALLELCIVAALMGGLSGVLQRPRVRGILGMVGGAVLCWMAWDLWGIAGAVSLAGGGAGDARGWFALVFAGVGVSISNPYFTGWWATVGSGNLAALGVRTRTDVAFFLAGHEAGDVVWYVFVAVVLVTGRGWLDDAMYRWLLTGCAVAIAALGVLFLGLGLRHWLNRGDGRAASQVADG